MTSIFSPSRVSVLFAAGAFALLANSSGVAHQQNKDRTGAPGSDNTCQQCHAGGNFNPQVNAFLVVDGVVEVPNYVPGAVHTLMVDVSSTGNPAGFGVHGTVVFEDGANAGELVDQDSNDCIWLDEVDGRHIFEQNDLCASGSFAVEWIAPGPGSGPVTVYVAAIAANGNGTSSGDVFEGGVFTFNEGVVGVLENKPAPIRWFGGEEGNWTLECDRAVQCMILGMDGRVLLDRAFETGLHTLSLNHQGWAVARCLTAEGDHVTQRLWLTP